MVIVGSESAIALRTLPLSCLITRAQTVPAEYVEALGEHSVLALHLAGRAGQSLFVLPQLLRHHLVQSLGKLYLLHTFDLASELRYLLLQTRIRCAFVARFLAMIKVPRGRSANSSRHERIKSLQNSHYLYK